MAFSLTSARTVRLFADLATQQQNLLAEKVAADADEMVVVPLPGCPICRCRPKAVRVDADGTGVHFDRCGHEFVLTRQALIDGLREQRQD